MQNYSVPQPFFVAFCKLFTRQKWVEVFISEGTFIRINIICILNMKSAVLMAHEQ